VSFVCNHCQETVKKPKLEKHKMQCRHASFTCIDCNRDFQGTEYRSHNQCISEGEKYMKALYKPVRISNAFVDRLTIE
jgi:cell growth-regulating nucleolar protein